MKILGALYRMMRSRSGATVIEYALIAGIICTAVVAGASALGQSANNAFTDVKTNIDAW